MTEPRTKPPRASTRHTWTRILLWFAPGVFAITSLIVLVFYSFPAGYEWIVTIGFLLGFAGLLFGGALFDAFIHLTRLHGRENLRPRMIVGWSLFYLGLQIFIIPSIGFLGFACCALVVGAPY